MKRTLYLFHVVFMVLVFAAPLIGGEHKKVVVMFDQGHNQRFVVEKEGELDLSRIASLFRQQGAAVSVSTGVITGELLGGVDVFVISGPFKSYSADEIKVLDRFVRQGGRVSVMLHVGSPFVGLLGMFKVAVSQGVIYEQENLFSGKQSEFKVVRLASHPINNGLKRFSIYGSWGLLNENPTGVEVARSSHRSWMDKDHNQRLTESDSIQSFSLVVAGTLGKGRYVVFGDDALFQNKFLAGENLVLANNLVAWLVDSK